MKSIYYKILSSAVLASTLLTAPLLVLAKEIPLYQEPSDSSVSSNKIDLSLGVIPIFTSKDGNWVKVGDPRNGNVGWIKNSELNNNGTSVIFSNRISNDGNAKSYSFQFGTPQKLTPEQEKALQRIEEQQAATRKAMQKNIQDMMNNFYMPGPILMPVIVVPAQPVKK